MLFRNRSKSTAPPLEDCKPVAEVVGALAVDMGFRVWTAESGAGDAVSQAVGWAASGQRAAVMLDEADLNRALPQIRFAIDRGIPVALLVRVVHGLETVFECGAAGACVLAPTGQDDAAWVVAAGLLTSLRSGIPTVVALTDSSARPMAPSLVAPVRGLVDSAPHQRVLDPARPMGNGSATAGQRARIAELLARNPDHVGGALSDLGDLAKVPLRPCEQPVGRKRQPVLIGTAVPHGVAPKGMQLARVRQLFPVPELSALLAGRDSVLALPARSTQILNWQRAAGLEGAALAVGMGAESPDAVAWSKLSPLDASPEGNVTFWGGLRDSRPATVPPDTERRNAGLSALLGDAVVRDPIAPETSGVRGSATPGAQDSVSPAAQDSATPKTPDTLPTALQDMRRAGAGSLLRTFWREEGFLRRAGRTSELVPSEADFRGQAPPMTAPALSPAPDRESSPVVMPAACTGCGSCWALCPESAIRPRKVDFDVVLTKAINQLDPPAVHLTRMGRPLIKRCTRLFREDGLGQFPTLDLLVSEVADRLIAGAHMEADQQESVREEIGRLTLPAAHLIRNEAVDPGALYLGIDADRCTGCGLCESVCQDGAIAMNAVGVFDPFDASLAELVPEELGALATQVGHSSATLAPTDLIAAHSAHAGLGMALRSVLAVMESVGQTRLAAAAGRVDDLRKALEAKAQELVDKASHINDFDALAGRLEGVRKASLEEVAQASGAAPLEDKRLRELASARALLDDLVGLAERCPIVGVIDGSVSVPEYPANPFAFPWLDASGHSEPVARSVVDGLRSEAHAQARLFAAAEGVLKNTGEDTPDEMLVRALVPQVVLLSDGIPEAAAELLAGSRPVLVVAAIPDPSQVASLLDLLSKGAGDRVMQVSLGDLDHLVDALRLASDSEHPTLVAVHTPTGSPIEALEASLRALAEGQWQLVPDRGRSAGGSVGAAAGREGLSATRQAGEAMPTRPSGLAAESASKVTGAPASAETSPPASGDETSASTDPDALHRLVDKLMVMSGFAPGSDGASAGLAQFAPPAEAEQS